MYSVVWLKSTWLRLATSCRTRLCVNAAWASVIAGVILQNRWKKISNNYIISRTKSLFAFDIFIRDLRIVLHVPMIYFLSQVLKNSLHQVTFASNSRQKWGSRKFLVTDISKEILTSVFQIIVSLFSICSSYLLYRQSTLVFIMCLI